MLAAALTTATAKPSDVNSKLAKYDNIPGAEKISLKLLEADKDVRSGEARTAADATQLAGFSSIKGSVLVEVICTSVDEVLIQKVKNLGINVTDSFPKYNRFNALLSELSTARKIAELDEVVSVNPVPIPIRRAYQFSGIANSFGPITMKGTGAVDQGFDGSGQIVGIISDSFAHTTGTQGTLLNAADLPPGFAGIQNHMVDQDTVGIGGSHDLPPNINIVRDDQFAPFIFNHKASDEGAAMAELVHDVAPGAGIAFHTGNGTNALFAEGIGRLRTEAGATIIVDDIGILNEPMFQDGIVAQAATAAVKSGVPYFSAAGNNGDAGVGPTPYKDLAPLTDDPHDGTTPPNGDDLHDWGGGNGFLPIELPPSIPELGVVSEYAIVLQWNQPFVSIAPKPKLGKSGARVDLDLYVTNDATVDALANPVALSKDAQGLTQFAFGDAVEIAFVSNLTTAPKTLFLAVDHFGGSKTNIPQNKKMPLEFRIVVVGASDEPIIQAPVGGINHGPTIYGHPLAAGVAAVAAVPYFDTPAFGTSFPPTQFIDPEFFSSRGGTFHIPFDAKGKAKKGRSATAPAFSAVDGGNTVFFPLDGLDFDGDGLPNFFGTSAAAPNAAAAAAIVKQKFPSASPAEVVGKLSSTAIDVTGERAATGWDDVSGAGLIDIGGAAGVATIQKSNLTFSEVPGSGGDKVVISQQSGASSDGSVFNANEDVFVTVEITNDGNLAATSSFEVRYLVDNVIKATETVPAGLPPGFVFLIADVNLGTFPAGLHTVQVIVDATDTVDEINEADNTVADSFFVTQLPDLGFDQLAGYSDELVVNSDPVSKQDNANLRTDQTIYAHFAIRNFGSVANASNSVVTVDGNTVATVANPTASNAVIEFDVSLGLLTEGPHEICVHIDPTNSVAESDETDNDVCKAVVVGIPNIAFITPAGFQSEVIVSQNPGSTQNDTCGNTDVQPVLVSFGVTNNGTGHTGNAFSARIQAIRVSDNSVVAEQTTTIQALAPGAQITIRNINLGTLAFGSYNVVVTLDSSNVVAESNEGDNQSQPTFIIVGTPAGDNLASAIDLNLAYGAARDICLSSTLATNTCATHETAETTLATGATHSIWFKWTAPVTGGFVTFNTVGSSFDTVMAAYSNFTAQPTASFANLTQIASNDNIAQPPVTFAAPFLQSQITINAQAGRTYLVQVDGIGGQTGTVKLNWACEAPVLRDHFSARAGLTTVSLLQADEQNKTATEEPLEPDPLVLGSSGKTVWYEFAVTSDSLPLGQEARNMTVTVTERADPDYASIGTTQPDKPRFDPAISIYTGNGSISGLSLYAFDTTTPPVVDPGEVFDSTTNARTATVSFVGFVGTNYFIQVNGNTLDGVNASSGRYDLVVTQGP